MVLSSSDKGKILAWQEVGVSTPEIAKRLNVNKTTVYRFLVRAQMSSPGKIPERKPGSGRPRKMTPSKISAISNSIDRNPMLSSSALKKIHPRKLFSVTTRTIRHSMVRDLGLKSFVPAKKPLLTQKMIDSRMNFCNKYKSWGENKWLSVMFSDESTMRLIRVAAGWTRVRRFPGSLERYKQKHLLPTVKKAGSVMVWGACLVMEGVGVCIFCIKMKP